MISTVSAVSIAAYMFSLLKFRGKWIQQQVAFLGVFLAGLTIIGQLDVLLPIYFVVSLLPFIGHISNNRIVDCLFLSISLVWSHSTKHNWHNNNLCCQDVAISSLFLSG